MRKALTQGFTTFLRRRHAQRHFARRPLLDALSRDVVTTPSAPVERHLGADMLLAARDEPAALIARLQSHDNGLSTVEATQRLARDGANEIEHEPPLPG